MEILHKSNIAQFTSALIILCLLAGCNVKTLLMDKVSSEQPSSAHKYDNYFVPINDFESEQMKLYTGSYLLNHYDYKQKNGRPELASVGDKQVVTELRTHVIENRYIKVSLLPQFGGRIISIEDKLSGQELLYQGKDLRVQRSTTGNFYNDWYIELGGVTPSLMRGEHGISWCMPWKTELVQADRDIISIKMSYSVPGLSGAVCSAIVSVNSKHAHIKTDYRISASAESVVSWYYRTSYRFSYSPSNTLFIPEVFTKNKDWFSSINKSEKAGVIRVAENYPEPGVAGLSENFTSGLFTLPLIYDLNPGESLSWSEYLYPVSGFEKITSANKYFAYYLTKDNNHQFYFTRPGIEYEIQFMRQGRLMFARAVTPKAGEVFEVSARSLPAQAEGIVILLKGTSNRGR